MQKNPEFEPSFKGQTLVNITSYDANNMYTTPCDGYIFMQNINAGESMTASVHTPDGVGVAFDFYTAQYAYTYRSLFVPKGMKIYGTTSMGSPIYFNGIREV